MYKNSGLALIKRYGSLSPLAYEVERKGLQQQVFRLRMPSWIPDWTAEVQKSDIQRMSLHSVYKACSGWRVAVFESEQDYWRHVADQMHELVRELRDAGERRGRLPQALLGPLEKYGDFLRKRAGGRQMLELPLKPFKNNDAPAPALHSGMDLTVPISRLSSFLVWLFAQGLPGRNSRGTGERTVSANREDYLKKGASPRSIGALSEATHRHHPNSHPQQRWQDKPDVTEEIIGLCKDMRDIIVSCHGSSVDEIKFTELFNYSTIFAGGISWMGFFDPDHPYPGNAMLDRRISDWTEMLAIESRLIGTTSRCCQRLYTWDEVTTSINLWTIGKWVGLVLECYPELTENRALAFLRTVVGGILKRPEGLRCITPEDEKPLAEWFIAYLLPRISLELTSREAWGAALASKLASSAGNLPSDDTWNHFYEAMRLVTENRVFFVTQDKRFGLGPSSMREDDEVHILPGGRTPFILRPEAGQQVMRPGDVYRMVGDCFFDDCGTLDGTELTFKGSLPLHVLEYLLLQNMSSGGSIEPPRMDRRKIFIH